MPNYTSNRLEQIAISQRNSLIASNSYDNSDPGNNYSATHTKALSDQVTPIYGKGTGVFLDTNNGGGDVDINGNPLYGGSGRLAAFANNGATWGYTPSDNYTTPDTTENIGQVVL
tara:strand:- start:2720 stop:3064 length:345 start_codon:yes stop_codon:yes gene_type:complete